LHASGAPRLLVAGAAEQVNCFLEQPPRLAVVDPPEREVTEHGQRGAGSASVAERVEE